MIVRLRSRAARRSPFTPCVPTDLRAPACASVTEGAASTPLSALVALAVAATACGAPVDPIDAPDAARDGSSPALDSALDPDAAGADDAGALPARPIALRWTLEDQPSGGDAPAGTRITDEGGAGLHGTTEGVLRWVPGQLEGAVAAESAPDGASIVLDAESAARIADVGDDESFRIEVGFRTDLHGRDGEAGSGTLVEREGEAGFRLSIEDGRLRFRVWSRGDAPSEVASTQRVADDRWHRVTAVRDRDTRELVLIVDGIRVDRAPDASGDLTSAAPLRALGGERPFAGRVDAVHLVRGRVDAPSPAPERRTSRVFEAGVDAQPGGGPYAAFRIPSIVRTGSGALLAFAEARLHDACDYGDIEIVMKRSTDGGATWSPLTRVVDAARDKAGNPIPIADGSRVVLLTTIDPVACEGTAACSCERSGAQRVVVRVSDDDGATWSPQRDVTSDVVLDGWGGMLLGPGHGIRLEHGPHAGTLVVAAMHDLGGRSGGHLLASDDRGETWRIAAHESDSPFRVNESTVAELADGSLRVDTRYQIGGDALTDAHREAGLRGVAPVTPELVYARSPAYALTSAFRGPVVEASLLARAGSERFGDERRLLFSYPAGEHGSPAGQRHDLRVYVSRDEGATWGPGRRVVGPWAAYSDLVALEGGSAGVLHEAGILPGDRFVPYQRIDFSRFGVEWLDERTLVSFGFEDRAPGEALGDAAAAGGIAVTLRPTGTVGTVSGRHHSTAARFDGASRACASAGVAGWLDFGRRDSFAIEARFRTTAHGTGGATAGGTLVSRTVVGSRPAWWLRVEDGRLRFQVASCEAATVNCGVMPGTCGDVGACTEESVVGGPRVDDGAWHRVRAVRDARAGRLVLEVDGTIVAEVAHAAGGIVKNEEPLCVGAFADGSRALRGDVDSVRIELVD